MNNRYNILLINDELFKAYSPVRLDSLTEEYTPYVLVAQETHIKEILGIALYEKLQDEICRNALTPEDSRLVVVIAPALANLACYVAAPFVWATWANKGITRMNSENSDAVDIKDIAQIRTWLLDLSNTYLDTLRNFLKTNSEDYPLWRDCECCPDDSGIAHPHLAFVPVKNRRRI